MSTPEKSVHVQYGVKLGPSAADGICRAFRIDAFRNGYLLKVPGAACFGSVIDAECFAWGGGEWWPVDAMQHKDSAAIRIEWLVWHIAKAMIKRGEKLSRDDLERLALTVQRLESWL